MKRIWKPVLCLLLAALTLTACAGQPANNQQFPEVTQALGPVSVTNTPVPVADDSGADAAPQGDTGDAAPQSIFDTNPYDLPDDFTAEDAIGEEGYIDPEWDDGSDLYTEQAAGTPYPYAGSTPIPLNPIDMPTPTPRPTLTFTYGAYSAASLGLGFNGPVGWQVDESQSQTFILREPDAQIKDGQQCIITITAEPVTANYSESDLKTQVNQRLDTIGSDAFTDFKPSYTATRYMLGSKGVYANYTGVLSSGVEIGGRVQYACVDRVLYGLEIVFPLGFKDDFIKVFGEIRGSLEIVN